MPDQMFQVAHDVIGFEVGDVAYFDPRLHEALKKFDCARK